VLLELTHPFLADAQLAAELLEAHCRVGKPASLDDPPFARGQSIERVGQPATAPDRRHGRWLPLLPESEAGLRSDLANYHRRAGLRWH
jgi:hypothetical protein